MKRDRSLAHVRDLEPSLTALDGIRGLAVLQVVLAHTHYILSTNPYAVDITKWTFVNRIFEPGYLGLDVFFTLSGFLITSLLLRDFASRGRTGERGASVIKRFYVRRALRLLPALYVMLALHWVWTLIINDVSLHVQWRNTYSAVFYIANWATVWNLSATNPDLGHLWSLAVEEQFYIVWPLVLLLITRFCRRYQTAMLVVASLALLVMLHRSELFNSGVNWLYVYIRTDTRVDSMLVGASFALVYRYTSINRRIIALAGWGGFFGILYYKFADPPSDLFTIGFTRTAVFAGFCILAAASGSWCVNCVLSWKPLTRLGRYSYGVYLYHHVVFLNVGRHMSQLSQSFRLLFAYGLSVLLTFLSWRLIESRSLKLKSRFESKA